MNKHHVLFNRVEWESRPLYKQLRRESGLIIPMDEEIHDELHRDVSQVPLLGHLAIQIVKNEFYRGKNAFETIDNLMFALDVTSKSEKLSHIDRSLAEIAIEAVGMQKPYIRFGTKRE